MTQLNSTLKKILLIGVICVFAGSTLMAGGNVLYRVAAKLDKLERTPAPQQVPEVRGGRMWMDNMMDTHWQAHKGGFGLKLTNKSDNDLVIIWKKSWVVDENGKKRFIITPSRLAGSAKKTKSTTIPVKGSAHISIVPKDFWAEQKSAVSIEGNMPVSGNSTWQFPVFRQVYTTKCIKKIAKKYRKKTGKKFDIDSFVNECKIEVVLNMEIGGTDYCYHATFKPYIFEKNEPKK